ncbi:hypothetical protein KIN20_024167 [Parelaphostrongylus tenuis]|uniref:Uncharacterized protein n=1 Tax=Parelaphostrongylus tenuis TaxID=148309 RepID=A0AAD5N7X5_PARTN|nr:hypothetical protein KIN20_024167 [Parelaphostrongylus tenuis]
METSAKVKEFQRINNDDTSKTLEMEENDVIEDLYLIPLVIVDNLLITSLSNLSNITCLGTPAKTHWGC